MQINKIQINAFAGLRDFIWEPEPGFNFIYGPNESGKSTIIAFVRSFFYGLGRQNKDPSKNARLRYTPWQSNLEMSGAISFSLRGKNYKLERSFARQKSGDQTKLWDQDNYREIPLQNPDAPGEELFGLSEDEFMVSAMVLGPGADDSGSHLDLKINRLLNSGSENYSALEISQDLKKREHSIESPSGKGQLPEALLVESKLRAKLAEALARDQDKEFNLNRQQSLSDELQKLDHYRYYLDLLAEQERLAYPLKRYDEFSRRMAHLEDQHQLEENLPWGRIKTLPVKEMGDLNAEAKTLRDQELKLQGLRQRIQENHQKSRQLSLDLHRARTEFNQHDSVARKHANLVESHNKQPYGSSKLGNIASLIVVILAIVVSFAFWALEVPGFPYNIFPVMLIALLLSVFFFSKQRAIQARRQKALQSHQKRVQLLMTVEEARNRAGWQIEQLEEELILLEHNDRELNQAFEEETRKLDYLRRQIDLKLKPYVEVYPSNENPLSILESLINYTLETEKRQEWLSQHLRGYSLTEIQDIKDEAVKARQELSAIEQELKKISQDNKIAEIGNLSKEELNQKIIALREKLAVEKSELRNLEAKTSDTANLELDLKAAVKRREDLEKDLTTIKLARSFLQEASDAYQNMSVPELHRRANNWLSILSLGRYRNLQISSNWELSVADSEGKSFYHDSFYSGGTRDLIRLSLRLALADMLAPRDAYRIFLFMDESLAVLDQDRLETAFIALKDYSEESARQSFYLTSSSEAKNFAESRDIPILELASIPKMKNPTI